MTVRQRIELWLMPLLLGSLSACMPPVILQGEFVDMTPRQAGAMVGTDVAGDDPQSAGRLRWGGMILSLENAADHTCFEVLGQTLDLNARPHSGAGGGDVGRFLACVDGYWDPEAYPPGRDVTVVGELGGAEVRQVGDYAYRYPRLRADTVYLWPKRQETVYQYVYDPFPYPYAYYYPYPYYVYPVIYVLPPEAPEPPPPGATPESLNRYNAALQKAAPGGAHATAGTGRAAELGGDLGGQLRGTLSVRRRR
jgi:outer membrane lipoprotein